MELVIEKKQASVYQIPRPQWEEVRAVVLHDTDGPTLAGALAHFDVMAKRDQARGYHFVIDRNGSVVQLVGEDSRTAHASSGNRGTIGIAFVGGSRGYGLIHDKQIAALNSLLDDLKSRHPIEFILGHRHVLLSEGAPSFRADPRIGDKTIVKIAEANGLRFDRTGRELLQLERELGDRDRREALACLSYPSELKGPDGCEVSVKRFVDTLSAREKETLQPRAVSGQ